MSDIFEDRVKSSRDNLKKMKPEQVAVDDEHCFVGFDAYRQLIGSGVDVVLIAPTSHFTPEIFEAAVAAGKHMLLRETARDRASRPESVQQGLRGGAVARPLGRQRPLLAVRPWACTRP